MNVKQLARRVSTMETKKRLTLQKAVKDLGIKFRQSSSLLYSFDETIGEHLVKVIAGASQNSFVDMVVLFQGSDVDVNHVSSKNVSESGGCGRGGRSWRAASKSQV